MLVLVSVLIALCALVYAQFKWRYGFWKRINVHQIEPKIPFGNLPNIFVKFECAPLRRQRFYHIFKDLNQIHGGYYVLTQPFYMPVNPQLIKQILTKDFHHFSDKWLMVDEKNQPISAHLFAIGGEKWKMLRQKLTPTFTSGKMKLMFETVERCTKPLLENLQLAAKNKDSIDVKDIAGKFTTDVIGSVAFGIECNSFKDPDSEFRKYGKEIFQVTFVKMVKGLFAFANERLAKAFGVVQFSRDSEKFFNRIVQETIDYRDINKVIRNDVMQLLINLMNKGSVDGDTVDAKNKITFDEVVAQAFVFFIAGFETSSTTITFVMFELAQHQDIQDKVREEIHNVLKKYNGKLTYDALNELVYMKQVIDEALRKYPPLASVDRKCTMDYHVPGTNTIIPAGTAVVIPVLGLQRDPEFYPDPLKFDPDRFSKENIHKLTECTYMPFGEGPRTCIGLRFGIMQTKVGLLTLLKDFRYTLNHKTNPEPQFKANFILTVKGDVHLDIEAIN